MTVGFVVLVASGCGDDGSPAATPSGAAAAYFDAVADGDAHKACELMTAEAARKFAASAGAPNCVFVTRLFHEHISVGPDANASELHDVQITGGDETQHRTVVTASLEGRSVRIAVVRERDEWRINSPRAAPDVAGLPNWD
jgi:hypothetical protein